MAAEQNSWARSLLIGAGVVAVCGGLWYLYSTRESFSQSSRNQDTVFDEQQTVDQEAKGDAEPEKATAKSSLPPLPERPTAAQRKSARSRPSSASTQDSSKQSRASETAAKVGRSGVSKSGDGKPSSAETTHAVDDAASDIGDDNSVLDWFQTADEIIIMLLVSDNALSEHVDYKLKPTYLEVKEKGLCLIQAKLPFPVQVEDSNWQFDSYQGKRVITVTLQKTQGEFGCDDWPHWKLQHND